MTMTMTTMTMTTMTMTTMTITNNDQQQTTTNDKQRPTTNNDQQRPTTNNDQRQTKTNNKQRQRWFIRLILQVPQGTPSASLTWETGLMDMKLRIWKEKVMLVLHIRSLDDNTLAKKIYNQQVEEGWPGLAKETKEIC